MKTGAVIVADQIPAMSGGDVMWMKQLGGTTVVKKVLTTLRQAGVSPVAAVIGYDAEEIRRHISHRGLYCVMNEHYEQAEFEDSVKMGLARICEECDRVLCLPADAALIAVDTVKKLVEQDFDADVCIPTWEGQDGFPVVIRTNKTKELLETDVSERQDHRVCRMEMGDPGVCLRIRTREEYDGAEHYAKQVRDANELSCNIKIGLARGENFMGPGLVELLLKIDAKGSMLAACQDMNMSYTKAWRLVKNAEDRMGFSFLSSSAGGSKGGNSRLTPEGRDFIYRYLEL